MVAKIGYFWAAKGFSKIDFLSFLFFWEIFPVRGIHFNFGFTFTCKGGRNENKADRPANSRER